MIPTKKNHTKPAATAYIDSMNSAKEALLHLLQFFDILHTIWNIIRSPKQTEFRKGMLLHLDFQSLIAKSWVDQRFSCNKPITDTYTCGERALQPQKVILSAILELCELQVN